MAQKGRKSSTQTKTRLLKEAEILAEKPSISDADMVKELKKYGIITTRQTVWSDRKKNLEAMTMDDIKKTKSAMLKEITELIDIAYQRSKSGGKDWHKAMDRYNKLVNTKAKIVAAFEQNKLAQKEAQRPVINVTIGKQKEYKQDGKDNTED